jgi:hypothetical protein
VGFKIAALVAGMALASSVHAAPLNSTNDPFGNRCTTSSCIAAARYLDSGSYDPRKGFDTFANENACVSANDTLGRFISRAGYATFQHEYSNGGRLSFDEAARRRALFFSETYYIREVLRADAASGDVEQCNRVRDLGISMVQQILMDNPLGTMR